MIPVQFQPEPLDFDEKVRQKGNLFLKKNAHPKKWDNHEYWRFSLQELWTSYHQVCAYSAQWIPWTEGSPTVDHFIPKSVQPELAYEWKNFRLSCLKMNARKRDFQDVLDPFQIQAGWFRLDFPSLLIKANPSLEESLQQQVKNTIKRLQLNDDDACVKSRQNWLIPYCKKEITFEFLRKSAPFIAAELERQDLVDREKIAAIMSVLNSI